MSSELVLDALIAATAVMVLAGLGSLALRRASGALRNSVWRAALGGVWLAPAVVIAGSLLHVQPRHVAVPLLLRTTQLEPLVVPGEVSEGASAPRSSSLATAPEVASSEARAVAAPVGGGRSAAVPSGPSASGNGSLTRLRQGYGAQAPGPSPSQRSPFAEASAFAEATADQTGDERLGRGENDDEPKASSSAWQDAADPGLRSGPTEVLVALWLIGAMVGIGAFVRDSLKVRALSLEGEELTDAALRERIARWSARIGLRQPPEAFQLAAVSVPSVTGWLRPRLLLPVCSSQAQERPQPSRETASRAGSPPFAEATGGAPPHALGAQGTDDAAIVHELAHVLRSDVAVQAAARLTRAFWWWHPLVWLVARQVRATAEEACDDWVVALTGERRGYAEILVRWAEGVQAVGGLACASRGKALVARVRRILEGKQMPTVRLSRRARAALAACLVGAIIMVAGVRIRVVGAAGGEAGAISGTVSGPEGKPVAQAQAWLVGTERDEVTGERDEALVASATSGADGGFTFRGVDLPEVESRWLHPHVVCYKPGLALGWSGLEGTGGHVKIALEVPEPVKGTILDLEGKPIVGAQVELSSVRLEVTGGPMERRRYTYLKVPPELQSTLRATTDEEGAFSFDLLAAGARPGFDIHADGYGTVYAWLDGEPQPLNLRLGKAASLSGRIVCPDAQEAAGRRLRFIATLAGWARWGEGWRYTVREVVVSDEAGQFALEELPPGEYTVYVSMGKTGKWQPRGREHLIVEAGAEAVELEVPLEQAWPIIGRVVHAKSGEPMPGVNVRVEARDRGQGMSSKTHENGRYLLYALPGEVYVSFWAPEGYVRAGETKRTVVVRASETTTVPDFMVKESVGISGIVVDEQGQPVGGADVWEEAKDRFWGGPRTTTDEQGRFEIANVPPGAPVKLYARAGEAVTAEPTVVDPARQQGLARVVVSEAAGCYLHGRVVDDKGKPLADIEVSINRYIQHWPEAYAKVLTDKGGRFESPVLLPGYRYKVLASAIALGRQQAYEWHVPPERTREWEAEAGKTHDVGEIIVRAARGTLAGIVVDSAGKPLAGVKVFNRGDGPRRTSTVTDAKGRFELAELYEGEAYAFAEMRGYRLSGVRARTGTKDLKLVLRREDEARPRTPAKPPVIDLARDRKLAETVALEGLEMTRGTKYAFRERTMAALVRANPEKGREVWEREGRVRGLSVLQELAYACAGSDPERALGYLAEPANLGSRPYALREVGKRVAAQDPELAARFFRESVAGARLNEDKLKATIGVAKAAYGMSRLGLPEARKLLQEAYEAANSLGYDQDECYARGAVAETICLVSLSSALGLVEGIPQQDRSLFERHMRNIAYRVAAENPEQGEQVLLRLAPGRRRDRAAVRVVYAMAGKDPKRALKLARSITDQRERSLALGNVAMAIGPSDRDLALATIEEAVGIQGDIPRPYFNSIASPAIVVAHLAKIALDIGYADMESLVMRAMSLRTSEEGARRGVMGWLESSVLAGYLAWVDTDLAREIIQSAPDAKGANQLIAGKIMVSRACAAALIDPEWALEIVRDLPPDEPGQPFPGPPKALSYYKLADYLSRPPEERWQQNARSAGVWTPGTDGC